MTGCCQNIAPDKVRRSCYFRGNEELNVNEQVEQNKRRQTEFPFVYVARFRGFVLLRKLPPGSTNHSWLRTEIADFYSSNTAISCFLSVGCQTKKKIVYTIRSQKIFTLRSTEKKSSGFQLRHQTKESDQIVRILRVSGVSQGLWHDGNASACLHQRSAERDFGVYLQPGSAVPGSGPLLRRVQALGVAGQQ